MQVYGSFSPLEKSDSFSLSTHKQSASKNKETVVQRKAIKVFKDRETTQNELSSRQNMGSIDKPISERKRKQAEIESILRKMPSFKKKRTSTETPSEAQSCSNRASSSLATESEPQACESARKVNQQWKLSNERIKKRKQTENSSVQTKNQRPRLRYASSTSTKRKKEPSTLQKLRHNFRKEQALLHGKPVPSIARPRQQESSERLETRLSCPLPKVRPQDISTSTTISKTNHVARKTIWTAEDDQTLLRCVKQYGYKWTFINNEYLGGRYSISICYQRYWYVIHPNIKKGPWSDEEEQKLLKAVEKYGTTNWRKIAWEFFDWTRPSRECRRKYLENLLPEHGRWTKEEDAELVRLRKKGLTWAQIGRQTSRGAHQSRQAYTERLDSKLSKERFSKKDMELLKKGHAQFGDNFAKISEVTFKGRRSTHQCSYTWKKLQERQSLNEFAKEIEKELENS